MNADSMHSGIRGLVPRVRLLQVAAPLAALVAAACLLEMIVQDTPGQLLKLMLGLVVSGAIGLLAFAPRQHRQLEFLRAFAREDRLGGGRTPAAAATELALLQALPSRIQIDCLGAGLLGGSLGLVASRALSLGVLGVGDGLWGAHGLEFLALVGLSTAVSALLVFYRVKSLTAQRRAICAALVDDSAMRYRPTRTDSLSFKLRAAIVLPAVAGMLLVSISTRQDSEQAEVLAATEWVELVRRELADADPALPLADQVAMHLPDKRFWPMPVAVIQLESDDTGARRSAALSPGLVNALDEAIAAGGAEGSIRSFESGAVAAYRVLEDGRVLVAETTGHAPRGESWTGIDPVPIPGLIALLVAVWLARLVAHDVQGSVSQIQTTASALAEGDLRAFATGPGEDEFGVLAGTLTSVGRSLKSTIGGLREASGEADRDLSVIREVVAHVLAANEDQFQKLEQSREWMGIISEQVREVSRSVAGLTATIDESSSAIFELGASGEQLKDTASILTSNIDGVSDSLEQMVHSVKQVSATTERLTAASEETSSSMEEMARAMRAADTSAETTASLSRDVVQKAELGQAKVVQTIVGMEAIREATDAAERVIRGLGARTNEIGGILDVIEDVADETNLLALNAAIIAAQAGEHGRAFSVVADEIKELADRVLASTKEIGSLIRSVQEESENAIGAIEAGSASVMSGVDLSAEAGRTLEEITEASRESGTRIAEIVSSVREQTKAASHVVQLMERVRESAEEIVASSAAQDRGNEVVYRTARDMREVAQQVHHTTEEQALGFGRIRENVEGVRGTVVQITDSIGAQSTACGRLSESLAQLFEGTRSNEESTRRLDEAMKRWTTRTERLRGDAARFRI